MSTMSQHDSEKTPANHLRSFPQVQHFHETPPPLARSEEAPGGAAPQDQPEQGNLDYRRALPYTLPQKSPQAGSPSQNIEALHYIRTRDIILPLQFYPKGVVVEKGVIEKRGVFWLDYRFEGRRLRTRIGPSKKLAETVMRKIRVQIAEGRYLDINEEKKIKFNDFAEIYAENHGKKKRSWVSTDKMYLNRLKDFFGKKYL